MRTGEIQANLVTLNETFKLPQIPDLIARKLHGPEQSVLDAADMGFHEKEYLRLRTELQTAHENCRLPEAPDDKTQAMLDDLLIRLRQLKV